MVKFLQFRMPDEHDQETETCCSASFIKLVNSKTTSARGRWIRGKILGAKVGKGLSEDKNGQHLCDRHWIETIDHPHHRYGHNLQIYHSVWSQSNSPQHFFFWLDHGDGKDVNLEDCPRTKLQQECVQYLGAKEREAYEVVINERKLFYKISKKPVTSTEGSKLMFVLSTSRKLYVGGKKKGFFHHSSFLAGAATIASGMLTARNGILEGIWPNSGHYRPTDKSLKEFRRILEAHDVDLTNVQCFKWWGMTTVLSSTRLSTFHQHWWKGGGKIITKGWMAVWFAVVLTLWLGRNDKVFHDHEASADKLFELIQIRSLYRVKGKLGLDNINLTDWRSNHIRSLKHKRPTT